MDWNEAGGSLMLWITPELFDGDPEVGAERTCQIRGQYGVVDSFVREFATFLKRAAHASAPVSRLQAESLAVLLLKHFVLREEMGFDSPRTATLPTLRRLDQVIEYINSNIDSELSIAALARIANVNPFYFARQFKTCTSFTPHEYVLQQRLERAKRLLQDLSLPIAEVAHSCGFASQAHLTTVFRRLVGITPKGYRACSVP